VVSNGNIEFNNPTGEHAVAGFMKHLLDFIIFYNPTVNSYKRLKYLNFILEKSILVRIGISLVICKMIWD
jgi:hypothetical protein